jgi:two-component system, LytTR family, response regulator
MRIRVLIVDDEPLARERIRDLLASANDVEILGECGNGKEAVAAIHEKKPDLLFLDVQMPHLDGFGVVEEVGIEEMPTTIFVTAYDRHALRAFEVHALDYLLKPFDAERFGKALERARVRLGQKQGQMNSQLEALLTDVQARSKPLERIMIKTSGRIFFLRLDEIDYIEAAGNYVRLHVGKEDHLLRETMSSLESKLDSRKFLRIHRSTIVNIESVKELQPLFHGEYAVLLRDGTQLTLSRGYRDKLEEHFGHSI